MTHTVPEVAESLGVSRRTVELWIANGELRAVSVSRDRNSKKPRLRVLDADLQAFLAGRSVAADRPQPRRRRHKQRPTKRYV